ncbi:MAG: hypothetical protein K9K67_09020 [Bacteriovoracaceae bacterium]|nr:hypothetical protein [Bacteriovoracaceae bacterium]
MRALKLICLLTISLHLNAREFPIVDRVSTQNQYLEVYPLLFNVKDINQKNFFKKRLNKLDSKSKSEALSMIEALDPFLPKQFLKAVTYYRYFSPSKEKLSIVLSYILMNKLLILRDAIDHPQTTNKQALINILRGLTEHSELNTDNLFGIMNPLVEEKAQLISDIENNEAFIEALKNTKSFTFNLKKYLKGNDQYSLSSLGFIPGNYVEVISENKVDIDRINWLNERIIFRGGVLDMDAPYIEMPMRPRDDGHPVFREDPIFMKIRDMIMTAQESIFIDIFLFGGTIGATLSEFLIEQINEKARTNPNFKVLILHDFATHYNMIEEMMPVFNYLKEKREKSERLKKHLTLLQANIQRHPSGIPFGLSSKIPKDEETFSVLESHHTYYESKIDHSKVIVIDGNTTHPQAYFGSKNWTDHSGGYYYDDALLIEGPAAALVQHSYYRDIEAALTEDENELKWFYFKEQGFSNKEYLPNREKILKDFKVTQTHIPHKGYTTVRLAEADVNGTIKNVRNILIDMIIRAKKTIYMEQLFLYDKYIVDALIKKKIIQSNVDIKILIDHNENFGMNGLPNTIFLKELKRFGIQIRARKTFGVLAQFPDGTSQEYHQENHRKITSVDGEVLLGGSSNLNPDTLQGSFREFGAQVFSQDEARKFDLRFMKDWLNPDKTMDLDIENFKAQIGGKVLNTKTSGLINDIGAQLLRSKDLIEKRH